MWCLETIVALNNKAAEVMNNGGRMGEAFAAVGIDADRKADERATVPQPPPLRAGVAVGN